MDGASVRCYRGVVTPRIIAVDWSGAASGAARRIWLAEYDPAAATVVRLEDGRSREELMRHLIDDVGRNPQVVIGLDFAFSLPAWYLRHRGVARIDEAWDLVRREGETWLAAAPYPFWGRPGRPRPDVPDHFRRTERELPAVLGIRPKSVLQIGGAGAVGTGSLRGMPFLAALRASGCAIWPFDAPRLPMVVEIYPRLLTGPVVKGRRDARARYMDEHFPWLPRAIARYAVQSDDAFDACVSALAMGRVATSFTAEVPAPDDVARLEGAIWRPPTVAPGLEIAERR